MTTAPAFTAPGATHHGRTSSSRIYDGYVAYLNRAAAAAGIEPPTIEIGGAAFLDEINRRAAEVPALVAEFTTKAAAAKSKKDEENLAAEFTAALTETAALNRVEGLGVLPTHAVREATNTKRAQAAAKAVADFLPRLAPAFDAAVAKLSAAANVLPREGDPLDPAAAAAAGDRDVLAAIVDAREALRVLSDLTPRREFTEAERPHFSPGYRVASAVLDVTEVDDDRANPLTANVSGDELLVRAARGEYGDGVAFNLGAPR